MNAEESMRKGPSLTFSRQAIFEQENQLFSLYIFNNSFILIKNISSEANKFKGSSHYYYTQTGPIKPQNSWWCLSAPPLA